MYFLKDVAQKPQMVKANIVFKGIVKLQKAWKKV